ncbi:DUF5305 domain-containing protein [Haloarcula halophila]|uniref:DUF5305 domain-containing protein n=1 Tax=Haloarcula TaxID=2237 RepID=UPI0023E35508|nr:DUF5305 domain-containing protein [Halomicroarcula sp. DFY41]
MNRRSRRLRTVVADNFAVLVAVLLIGGAVGGYLAYTTHVEPGTTTETREVSSWRSTFDVSHRARVVNGTDAFGEGTVLRNRNVYFRRISPRLNGSVTYSYAASDGGTLNTTTTVLLVFRSVGATEGGNTTVYWSVERPLAAANEGSLAPDERTNVPFSVNVTAATAEARRIEEQLGGSPGTLEVSVLARTNVSGTRNGQPVDVTRTNRLRITADGGVYRVSTPGPVVESDSQSEPVTVPAEYGPVRRIGSPLLLGIALCGLLGLTGARYTGRLDVSEAERQWLAYQETRAEFDEWITTGRVPTEADGPPTVTVDSLEGLVDVAIDTDNRVIEDPERGACLVLGSEQWFRYDAPADPLAEDTGGIDPLDQDADGDRTDGDQPDEQPTDEPHPDGDTTG